MSSDEQQDNEYYRRAVRPVVDISANYYAVAPEQVYSHGRTKTAANARQVAMYLSRVVLGFSYPEIGKAFGRDHTTVMSACKKVTEQRVKEPKYNTLIEGLQQSALKLDGKVPEAATDVVFPPKVWERLKTVRESGMFGDDMATVVARLVAMKLFEMDNSK